MALRSDRKISIWAVSDCRAGMANQVLGLAEAIAWLRPAEIVAKRVQYRPPIGRSPQGLSLFPLAVLAPGADRFGPPWPDLWIAAGRATLPLSAGVRRWS